MAAPEGDCPPERLLGRWRQGALAPAPAARLARHLQGCAPCRQRARELAGLERALDRAFAAAAGTLPDQDGRVLARLERLGVRRRPRRRAPMWLAVLYAAAGLLLLGGYLGYATVLRLQLRAELERGTRQQVRALGTVLGLYAERTGALPAGGNRELVTALLAPRDGTPSSPRPFFCPPAERLRGGLLTDAFGQPLVYRGDGHSALLYSVGPNGRDEGGGGDDLALVLP